jgi:hypothetical protein
LLGKVKGTFRLLLFFSLSLSSCSLQ